MLPPTVLVVDDDRHIIDLIALALDKAGYRVVAAVGENALHAARTCQPRVILLDVGMPGMDGIEVSRCLRADPLVAAVPIVIMSTPWAAAAVPAASGFLPKPFRLADLYAAVARWIPAA